MSSVRFAAPFNPALKRVLNDPQRHAPILGYLMTPVALTAYVLAFWRLAADMNWAGDFFIAKGLLSRWQVWLALGIALHAGAHNLTGNRRKNKRTVS